MIAVLLIKIAFWGRYALQKLLGEGGEGEGGERGLHDCFRLPRLLTTNTRQLEIFVTTLLKYY